MAERLGFEPARCKELKEFCGAIWPSKELKRTDAPCCLQKPFIQRHDASRDGRLKRRKPIPGLTLCKREPVSNDFES
jgi:hypothetical protein